MILTFLHLVGVVHETSVHLCVFQLFLIWGSSFALCRDSLCAHKLGSLLAHIPQSVSEAWSNMPSSPEWFNTKTPPRPQLFAPGTEGAKLCGPKLCCLLWSLKLVGIFVTLSGCQRCGASCCEDAGKWTQRSTPWRTLKGVFVMVIRMIQAENVLKLSVYLSRDHLITFRSHRFKTVWKQNNYGHLMVM